MPPGSDDWRDRHGSRRRGPWRWGPPGGGRRPPWWPEGEAWPPPPEAWRTTRRRFARRVALAALALALTVGLLAAGFVWLLGRLIGASSLGAAGALIVFLGFVIVARWALRSARAAAAPIGELIEASGRVEAGELGIQVVERGSPEARALARSFNAMSARLARTEEVRRTLFAEVSHELRTPLTVIAGTVEGMLDGIYPADADHLERIRAEARQLERLIDDLRTLSLAEAGALVLNRELSDIVALAREVVAGFGAQADAAGLHLEVRAPAGPVELEIDPHRIHEVLANLVANALRHTPGGGAVVVEIGETSDRTTIVVRDTGAGMSADAVAHAFDRFWRSGEAAGAGLGLAIVKDLVTAHGGSVGISSEPGKGTSVTCSLPRRAA